MSMDNNDKLPELNEEKLAEDELEHVSGGQIQLDEDDSTYSVNGAFLRGIGRGDHIA